MKKITEIAAHSLKGGVITSRDRALLPFGGFAQLQNMRNTIPGLEQRKGQRKLHTTADSTNGVVTLYQFAKTYTTERRLFAQMSDGDILEATNAPPTVTSGVFGSESFDGAADQVPASWGVLEDLMVMCNGKDPVQIFAGEGSAVEKCIVWKGSADPADVPQGGEDYSDQVSDVQSSSVAVFSSLDTYTNHHCIFIRTPVPASSLAFTVVAANANAATLALYYWKNDHTWASVTVTDGTASGGATLAQSGTVSWTPPADMMPKYAFGSCGFWYQLRVSAALDSSVTVSGITYGASWQPLQNLWDGSTVYGLEVQVEGTSQWETYPAGAVDLSLLAAGKKVYVAFSDPVEGIYLDVGSTPTATGLSLSTLKYWDGNSWESVGTPTDGSAGLTQTGWITFPRCAAQPLQFHTTIYQAYWYELTWSGGAVSDDTVVAFQGMPYYDITDFGRGYTYASWKERACYTFDLYGAYIYVAAASAPFVLNGLDYGILKAGDGRANRVVAMRRFYNELMVWQEEKGVEGGCVTIFEGYSPSTFGKILLSSKIGGMNAKAVAVVDGVTVATKTDESIKTLAFWLSRYGVCCTEGRTVYIVSDDIANYFDPSKPECIRYGYEKEMWLEHDPVGNCLRIGLVSGATATKPNVFPVFDLVTKTWGFDTLAQPLGCMANIEPGSGSRPVVQVGGGTADGFVYELNYGDDDVTTPVDALVEIFLGRNAMVIELAEFVVRFAAQVQGSALMTLRENGNTRMTRALSMLPEKVGHTSRRHRLKTPATSDMLSLEFRNKSRAEILKIYDIGVECYAWENK